MKKLFVSAIALLAAGSLWAQDVTPIYNEAAAAYSAKDFATAAAKFEQVIDQGMDLDEAASMVATAKSALPKCYFQLGGAAAMRNKDYATAAEIFAKGYKADPDNTGMALNLAMSYCEMGNYAEGMEIYEAIAAKTHPKYAEDVAKAKEMMALYTNNKVAAMQQAGDFDGIIAMADAQLEKNPESALFQNVRLQAYANKKDYAKVIELGEAAAAAQTDEADKSLMYYLLGAAYNARDMKPQAIEAFKQVTAGPAAQNAAAALAELSK